MKILIGFLKFEKQLDKQNKTDLLPPEILINVLCKSIKKGDDICK